MSHHPGTALPSPSASWRRPLVLLAASLLTLPILLGGCACCDAITGADEVKEDDSARKEYFESAALTYYDGGRYDLAQIQFTKVLEIEETNKKARRGLAKSLYMEVINSSLPREVSAHKLRTSQAIFEQIVGLDWAHAEMGDRTFEVQTDLALVYAELADLYDRDIRDLKATLRRDPNADDELIEAGIRSDVEKRNALLYQAIPLFRTVLRTSKNNPYALAGLAKAHLQLGNEDLGVEFAKRYLKLSQDSQFNWKSSMDRYAEAVGGASKMTQEQRQIYIQKIHGAREKEKKMHLMLASVYMRRGQFGAAVTEYSSIIKIDSTVPAAFVERAQAYGALQQYKPAIADLEEYLRITDPQMHRSQRLNAVELLDRYQAALSRQRGVAISTRDRTKAVDPWARSPAKR